MCEFVSVSVSCCRPTNPFPVHTFFFSCCIVYIILKGKFEIDIAYGHLFFRHQRRTNVAICFRLFMYSLLPVVATTMAGCTENVHLKKRMWQRLAMKSKSNNIFIWGLWFFFSQFVLFSPLFFIISYLVFFSYTVKSFCFMFSYFFFFLLFSAKCEFFLRFSAYFFFLYIWLLQYIYKHGWLGFGSFRFVSFMTMIYWIA